uniref:SERPIN domain-containing protein n=2 Tax=Onchocerca TaxID=6281 RepID=A0A8R1XPU6_ONCVO
MMINQAIIAMLFLITCIQFVLIFGESTQMDYAQFNFAVRLIRETVRSDQSVILSPASISTALFMIYHATDGEMKQRLQKILGGNARKMEIQRYFSKILADNVGTRNNNNYILNIANRFYVRQGFSMKPSLSYILQFYYGEKLHHFNYEQRNHLAQEINNWLSDKINRKITELMITTNIKPETKILILNAICFKGTWKEQFSREAKSIFHISHNKKKKVNLVIILPKIRFNLLSVREKMTGRDLIMYIKNAIPTEVKIKLPKFGLRQELNLEDTLKKFGIMDSFSENDNLKRLSDNPISVSSIIHDAFFEVNEGETGIAAEIGINSFDFPSKNVVIFNADQPFLYFVVKNLQIVLFAGQCGYFCSF